MGLRLLSNMQPDYEQAPVFRFQSSSFRWSCSALVTIRFIIKFQQKDSKSMYPTTNADFCLHKSKEAIRQLSIYYCLNCKKNRHFPHLRTVTLTKSRHTTSSKLRLAFAVLIIRIISFK